MGKTFKPVEEMTMEERRDALMPSYTAAMDKNVFYIPWQIDEAGDAESAVMKLNSVFLLSGVNAYYSSCTKPYRLAGGQYYLEDTREYTEGRPRGNEMRLLVWRSEAEVEVLPENVKRWCMDFTDPATGETEFEDVVLVPLEPEPGKYITFADVIISFAMNDAETEEEARRIHDLFYLPFTAAAEPAKLPKQDQLSIRKYTEPITKVANLLSRFLPGAPARLDVAGTVEKRRGKKIETLVSINVDELGEEYSLSAPIDNYDRDIQGGLATLFESGVRTFTVEQLARAMGYTASKISPATLEDLKNRIEKQRRIFLTVDFSQEARGRILEAYGDKVKDFKLEGHLIDLIKAQITTVNGRVVEGYIMAAPPLLLYHAQAVGQVVTYEKRYIEAGSGRTTRHTLMAKRELARIVKELKNKKGHRSNKVSYEHIYKLVDLNADDRDARKRMNDFVLSWLEDMKDAGEIVGYRETTKRTSGHDLREGVEIIV